MRKTAALPLAFLSIFAAAIGLVIFIDGDALDEMVAVNLAALERGGGVCYAIGTGKRTSVNEIHSALAQITGFTATSNGHTVW